MDNYLVGFEVELFVEDDKGTLILPPKDFPVDGFPGLVEVRSQPRSSVYLAYGDICAEMARLESKLCPGQFWALKLDSAVFPRELRAELRRRHHEKRQVDIQNLYGKKPRMLGNKTLASVQVNLSHVICPERWSEDGKSRIPARYGLLDVPKIVRALDVEFGDEIKASKRQPGEYAIKDEVRLEYRSLPTSIFPDANFLSRLDHLLKTV